MSAVSPSSDVPIACITCFTLSCWASRRWISAMYSEALALGRPSAITGRSAVAMVPSLARLPGRLQLRADRLAGVKATASRRASPGPDGLAVDPADSIRLLAGQGRSAWCALRGRAARHERGRGLTGFHAWCGKTRQAGGRVARCRSPRRGVTQQRHAMPDAVASPPGLEAVSSAEPVGSQRYLTVSLPTMPPSRWPGTEQKNVYSPGLRSTVTSEVAPPLTTGPFSLRPLPSTAMLWSLVCGFS